MVEKRKLVNIGVIATQPGEAISEVLKRKRLDGQLQASKAASTGISISVT